MGSYTGSLPRKTGPGIAIIGKSVRVLGEVECGEDLHIDGVLEGNLECIGHSVTVGPEGVVRANVKAREIVILGTIEGNVEAAAKLEIRSNATLLGDARTPRIVVEDGGYFKGAIDIVKSEPVEVPRAVAAGAPVQGNPTA
jgi:cytoskeletal protein CcmA (bactofilin family)